MQFRLIFDMPHLAIYSPDVFEFEGGSGSFQLTARLLRVGDETTGHWQCEAICDCKPKKNIQDIFDRLSDGSLDPNGEWEQFGLRRLEWIGPTAYRSFVDNVHEQLTVLSHRSVSVLRWRLALGGSHETLRRTGRLWWSLDGDEWRAVPGVPGAVAGGVYSPRTVNDTLQYEVKSMVKSGAVEPLGHELLRESIELRRSAGLRSAFVVAVIAAEVGLKECVADLLPQTEWLIKNVPTPPLVKMLRELLPKVPARCTFNGKVLPPPKRLCDVIDKAVKMRNQIVHKGSHRKVEGNLGDLVGAVRDLLFLLDYYRGCAWAIHSIGPDTRNDLPALNESPAS